MLFLYGFLQLGEHIGSPLQYYIAFIYALFREGLHRSFYFRINPMSSSAQDSKLTKFEGVKEKYSNVVDAYLVFMGTKISTEQNIFWKKQFSHTKNQATKNFIHIPFL